MKGGSYKGVLEFDTTKTYMHGPYGLVQFGDENDRSKGSSIWRSKMDCQWTHKICNCLYLTHFNESLFWEIDIYDTYDDF